SPCLCERGDLEKTRVAAASRGVRLQYVDGARLEHAAKIEGIVAIFAGCDLDACRRTIADEPEAFAIVARDRFLEPRHAEIGELVGQRQRLLARVRAIGIGIAAGLAGNPPRPAPS